MGIFFINMHVQGIGRGTVYWVYVVLGVNRQEHLVAMLMQHPASRNSGEFTISRRRYNSRSSSAAVMEKQSYTSSHPLGHTGPVMGSLYLEAGTSFSIRSFQLGAVSVMGEFRQINDIYIRFINWPMSVRNLNFSKKIKESKTNKYCGQYLSGISSSQRRLRNQKQINIVANICQEVHLLKED